MPRRPTNYPPEMPKRPKDPIDRFVFDFGFPGTPVGDRMKAGLLGLAGHIWNNAHDTYCDFGGACLQHANPYRRH